jgi:hypothetical protein
MTTVAVVGTVIGKGLLMSALNDLYVFVKESTHNGRLEQVLTELDIRSELDVVKALLDDTAHFEEFAVIKVASDQLREAVQLVHHELRSIQDELELHRKRYFHTWRHPNCESHIKKLRRHRVLLRKRRELLISVLSVWL